MYGWVETQPFIQLRDTFGGGVKTPPYEKNKPVSLQVLLIKTSICDQPEASITERHSERSLLVSVL